MQMWERMLELIGVKAAPVEDEKAVYQRRMRQALSRIRLAELQIQEATSLEELDIARSELQSGFAEVQQLVRSAKRDRGIALRTIAENEEIHRNLRQTMQRGSGGQHGAKRRKTGTNR